MNPQSDLDVMKERMLLLQKARSILNEQYLKNNADLHKKWQEESHQVWITKGSLLPYNAGFSYPTEEEVVAKALEIYNEQNKNKPEIDKKDIKEISPWQLYLTPEKITAVEEQPVEPSPEAVNAEPITGDVNHDIQ